MEMWTGMKCWRKCLFLSAPLKINTDFFLDREMKCLRHKIHLNLFVSVLSANLAWLLVYVITVGGHPWIIKLAQGVGVRGLGSLCYLFFVFCSN